MSHTFYLKNQVCTLTRSPQRLDGGYNYTLDKEALWFKTRDCFWSLSECFEYIRKYFLMEKGNERN